MATSPRDTRAELIDALVATWRPYEKEVGGSNSRMLFEDSPYFFDPADQMLAFALHLVEAVRVFNDLERVERVRIGDIEKERRTTLDVIRWFRNASGVVYLRTSSMPGAGSEDVDPFDGVMRILVSRARQLGASWQAVGDAMAVSRQAARIKAIEKGWINSEEVLEGDSDEDID